MKNLKKLLALVLAGAMALTFAACGAKTETETAKTETETKTEQSDLEYIKEKGKLVIGITDFEPMDYKDADGNWIGFDADMAKAFAKSLGVEAEFVEIEWSNKVLELNGKSIDCVWNGMTLTPEVTSAMDCTKAYCNNQQVVVVPVDKADRLKLRHGAEGNYQPQRQCADEGNHKQLQCLQKALIQCRKYNRKLLDNCSDQVSD